MDVWPNKQVFGKGLGIQGVCLCPPSKTGFDIAGLGSHALNDYLRLYLHFARSNQLFHFWSRMVAIAKDYAEREAWVPGGENLDGSTESTGDENSPPPREIRGHANTPSLKMFLSLHFKGSLFSRQPIQPTKPTEFRQQRPFFACMGGGSGEEVWTARRRGQEFVGTFSELSPTQGFSLTPCRRSCAQKVPMQTFWEADLCAHFSVSVFKAQIWCAACLWLCLFLKCPHSFSQTRLC